MEYALQLVTKPCHVSSFKIYPDENKIVGRKQSLWLRNSVTSRKVARSIPDVLIGNFFID